MALVVLVGPWTLMSEKVNAEGWRTPSFWTIDKWIANDDLYFLPVSSQISIVVSCSMEATILRVEDEEAAKEMTKSVGSVVGVIHPPSTTLEIKHIKGVFPKGEPLFIVPKCKKLRNYNKVYR